MTHDRNMSHRNEYPYIAQYPFASLQSLKAHINTLHTKLSLTSPFPKSSQNHKSYVNKLLAGNYASLLGDASRKFIFNEDICMQILNQINEMRQRAGVPNLTFSTACALNADWSAQHMAKRHELKCLHLIQKAKSLGFSCQKVAEVSAKVALSPNFMLQIVQVMMQDSHALSKQYEYAGVGLKVDSEANTVFASLLMAGELTTASSQYWIMKK